MNDGAVRFEDVTNLETRDCLYREILFPRHCATGFGRASGGNDVGHFFRKSEETGLVVWLDRAMLEFCLEQLHAYPNLCLGVNLSYTSIVTAGASMLARVKSVGQRISRRLILEVTETAYNRDSRDIRHTAFFAEMRRLGARIAIDDFGAGLHDTPLPVLNMTNADIIKIDGSIISGWQVPANKRRIDAAILHGRRSGAVVVAEHIESEETLTALRGMGIAYGQGWLLH
jgi:EAL domain-containing protein (putative c-di-GMP-specific phosphodiesterase class I)